MMYGMTVDSGHQQATGQKGTIPSDSFAHRLMLARAHAGHLSIREAADLCDLGRGAWTNWEKGARPADILEITEIISDKLGVDRDWLLFGGALAEPEGRTVRTNGRRTGRLYSDYRGSAVRSARRRRARPIGHGAQQRQRPNGRPATATHTGPWPERPTFTRLAVAA